MAERHQCWSAIKDIQRSGLGDRLEAELGVNVVRIARGQDHPAEIERCQVRTETGQQRRPNPLPSRSGADEHIPRPGERGAIRDGQPEAACRQAAEFVLGSLLVDRSELPAWARA